MKISSVVIAAMLLLSGCETWRKITGTEKASPRDAKGVWRGTVMADNVLTTFYFIIPSQEERSVNGSWDLQGSAAQNTGGGNISGTVDSNGNFSFVLSVVDAGSCTKGGSGFGNIGQDIMAIQFTASGCQLSVNSGSGELRRS